MIKGNQNEASAIPFLTLIMLSLRQN